MDEVLLAERLIGYDTSRRSGIGLATDFVAGWLEAQGAAVERMETGGRRCLVARVGAGRPRAWCCTATWTSCPGIPSSSRPGSRAAACSAAAPTT